jgi:hypothetical protein
LYFSRKLLKGHAINIWHRDKSNLVCSWSCNIYCSLMWLWWLQKILPQSEISAHCCVTLLLADMIKKIRLYYWFWEAVQWRTLFYRLYFLWIRGVAIRFLFPPASLISKNCSFAITANKRNRLVETGLWQTFIWTFTSFQQDIIYSTF